MLAPFQMCASLLILQISMVEDIVNKKYVNLEICLINSEKEWSNVYISNRRIHDKQHRRRDANSTYFL